MGHEDSGNSDSYRSAMNYPKDVTKKTEGHWHQN